MPADTPTILATSGGYRPATAPARFNSLVHHAVELSGVTGRAPRVTHSAPPSATSAGSTPSWTRRPRLDGFDLTHLNLFPMPSVDDVEGYLLGQDVVWVNGGSVANLLAVWRRARPDQVFRRVWQAGVVLAGVSAGSICWSRRRHDRLVRPRAATRSRTACTVAVRQWRALRLRGAAPARSCTSWSPTARCRPTHCTDDGVGLVYRGTELVEAVTEQAGGRLLGRARTRTGGVTRDPLDPRRL